jgi:hypothetical protein
MVLRPLDCWNCGFVSRRVHGSLFLVSVVCYQVEVSASRRSLRLDKSYRVCVCVCACFCLSVCLSVWTSATITSTTISSGKKVVKTKQERKIFITCAWLAVYYFIVCVCVCVYGSDAFQNTSGVSQAAYCGMRDTAHIGFARMWEEMIVGYWNYNQVFNWTQAASHLFRIRLGGWLVGWLVRQLIG